MNEDWFTAKGLIAAFSESMQGAQMSYLTAKWELGNLFVGIITDVYSFALSYRNMVNEGGEG